MDEREEKKRERERERERGDVDDAGQDGSHRGGTDKDDGHSRVVW